MTELRLTPTEAHDLLASIQWALVFIRETMRKRDPRTAEDQSTRIAFRSLFQSIERLQRAASLLIPSRAPAHDAGAYAQCMGCGLYSLSPLAISAAHTIACDCGRTEHWTGSFTRPGPDDRFALELGPEWRALADEVLS